MGNKITAHFSWAEFDCHDGSVMPERVKGRIIKLCEQLEILRAALGASITITSGWRSAAYNKKIGGAKYSQHFYGNAADIKVKGYTPVQVANKIEELIKKGEMQEGGLGVYSSWVHYDIRGFRARWKG